MIEKVYNLTDSNKMVAEKIVLNEHIQYIHFIFNKGEGRPEHFANGTLYMTVIRGTVSLQLDDQEEKKYPKGSIINIPLNTKMNVRNKDEEVLEVIVVKLPPFND